MTTQIARLVDVTSSVVQPNVTGVQRVALAVAASSEAAGWRPVRFDARHREWRGIDRLDARQIEGGVSLTASKVGHRLFRLARSASMTSAATRALSGSLVRDAEALRWKLFHRGADGGAVRIHDVKRAHILMVEPPSSEEQLDALMQFAREGGRVSSFIHDFLPLTHSEYFPLSTRLDPRWLLRLTAVSSDFVVSSETCRRQLEACVELLGMRSPQVWHLPLPPTGSQPVQAWKPPRVPTFVALGRLERRKNLPHLLRAASLIAQSGQQVAIQLVGDASDDTDLRRHISGARQAGVTVDVPGRLDDSQVQSMLRAATALVFVSHGEGYGLPIVEALNQGCPVVAVDRPELREHARHGGMLFVKPNDVWQLAATMSSLCSVEYRSSLAQSILLRELSPSWSAWSEQVLRVLSRE